MTVLFSSRWIRGKTGKPPKLGPLSWGIENISSWSRFRYGACLQHRIKAPNHPLSYDVWYRSSLKRTAHIKLPWCKHTLSLTHTGCVNTERKPRWMLCSRRSVFRAGTFAGNTFERWSEVERTGGEKKNNEFIFPVIHTAHTHGGNLSLSSG